VDTIYSGTDVYSVSAYDTHGNVSIPSSSVTVTFTAPSPSAATPSSGLTSEQIDSILSLLASFGANSTTIANVRAVLTGTGGAISGSVSSSSFAYNLTLYQTDPEVKTLQQFLNAHGFTITSTGSGSPGNETTYFGVKTYTALAKFQESVGLPATGWLGPMTRAKIAALF
jgi:peptidoglycan hydrolase-like protein with peptidoglycan-binding domain